MYEYKPTVLLWLRRITSADQVRNFHQTLAGQSGVLAVQSSVRNPRLMLIEYDGQRTTSQQILRIARDRDHTARLIGI